MVKYRRMMLHMKGVSRKQKKKVNQKSVKSKGSKKIYIVSKKYIKNRKKRAD